MATMVAASSARLDLFLEFDGAPPRRSIDFHLVTRPPMAPPVAYSMSDAIVVLWRWAASDEMAIKDELILEKS
jgi:hypothetical protein